MTTARCELVDPALTRWYHCISRCVRRAFLCGEGFEHCKTWIENRLQTLAENFAVSVGGFAVMDNHLHVLCRLDGDGSAQWSAGKGTMIAAAFEYVPNQGDAWQYILNALERDIGEMLVSTAPDIAEATSGDSTDKIEFEPFVSHLPMIRVIGERTGQLHRALADGQNDANFSAEAIGKATLKRWRKITLTRAKRAFASLRSARTSLSEDAQLLADHFLAEREKVESFVKDVAGHSFDASLTRIHGDLHLGQVLIAEEDCVILDFEGEPARPMQQRREKGSPMQDVAGMLRSLDYLRQTVAQRLSNENPATAERTQVLLDEWHERSTVAFLTGYRLGAGDTLGVPNATREAALLLRYFMLDKALYEINYEAANRPRWIGIPVIGAMRLTNEASWTRKLWEASDGAS